jgi:hypothetical protein
MARFPGKSDMRSPPYQRVFTSFASDISLVTPETDTVAGSPVQASNATTGLTVEAQAADVLVWEDCSGKENTLTFALAGVYRLPFAAVRIDSTTTVTWVLAEWHPSNVR